MPLIYPNIFVVGPSGSGKSSCLRNMNPETTAILNIERKQLPFRAATKFIHNKFIDKYSDVAMEITMGYGMNPAIETIVVESFASLDEAILSDARATKTGWDVFSYHNQTVRNFINSTKYLSEARDRGNGKIIPPKFVVFLGLDEIVNIALPSGNQKSSRRIKVEGRELQGSIEKEFTIVVFTEVKEQTIGNQSATQYQFMVNTDGITSAKTPMGMFSSMFVDNDLAMLIRKIKEYFELK